VDRAAAALMTGGARKRATFCTRCVPVITLNFAYVQLQMDELSRSARSRRSLDKVFPTLTPHRNTRNVSADGGAGTVQAGAAQAAGGAGGVALGRGGKIT